MQDDSTLDPRSLFPLIRELAKRVGLTLIGYVRGDSFTVYSHPARLVLPQPSPAPVLIR